MKNVVFLITIILFVSCAKSGTRISPEQFDAFEEGKSTQYDVMKALGAPNYRYEVAQDNTVQWIYSYAQSTNSASSYIPIAGAISSSSSYKTETTTFIFDKDTTILKTKNQTKYGGESKAGLAHIGETNKVNKEVDEENKKELEALKKKSEENN